MGEGLGGTERCLAPYRQPASVENFVENSAYVSRVISDKSGANRTAVRCAKRRCHAPSNGCDAQNDNLSCAETSVSCFGGGSAAPRGNLPHTEGICRAPEGICRALREFAARGSEYVMHGNECVMRGDFYRRAAYSGPKHY